MEKQLKDTLNFIIENSTNDNIRKSNIFSIPGVLSTLIWDLKQTAIQPFVSILCF